MSLYGLLNQNALRARLSHHTKMVQHCHIEWFNIVTLIVVCA